MNQKLLIVMLLSSLFFMCKNKRASSVNIIGTWASVDSAILKFKSDSSLSATNLPAEYFSFYTLNQEIQKRKVNGLGKWYVENKNGFQEVKLNFSKMNGKDQFGFYSVFVAGEKGALENNPPWFLFIWKGEEGGERYEFIKK